ncbi:hypothetical protein AX14_012230 [Amanita brunnescens Koide BX004]|nr:hypothetical protein AX14_012230 [Amanita brunnescens Koide BX004]
MAETPSTPVSPLSPAEAFVATTDEDYPRFRILIVGRSGVGKSSLINTIFKAPLAEVQHDKAGAADINNGITSPHNKHLILHDSEGYEPGEEEKFRTLEKFILEQTQKQSPAERLHAIWLCIPASYSGGRLFERGEEKIFKLNRNKVPIIVVITKFDLYVAGLQRRFMKKKISYQSAEEDFNKKYGPQFGKNSITKGLIPHVLVSKTQFDTFQRLVQITRESIRTETPGVSSGHGRGSDEDRSGSAQIALATAQRVDIAGKVDASIKVGKKKYWTAIGSGLLWNKSLENCLKAIHKDIITIWNIRDLHDYLLGDAFHRRMMVIVEDLKDAANTMQSKVTVTSAMAGLAKLWTNSVFREGPEHMRCLMGYVVDLTLILQAIFQVSLQDRSDGKVAQDNIDEIIYEFHCSEKKKNIHDAIRKSIETGYIFARENVVNEIASLIEKYEMTLNDTKLDRQRPAIRSLLPILRFELTANGLEVNATNIAS